MEGNELNDIFGQPARTQRVLAHYKVDRMVLSPSHWRHYKIATPLNWKLIRFNKANTKEIPTDCSGVYCFLAQPGIAQHPTCSYLLYVGKTEQPFRKRYSRYIFDGKAGDKSDRIHVTEMLEKWAGFLWFAYAPIADKGQITKVEDALLESYLPPVNKEFPATVSAQVKELFGN